ncbi:unnamed protein product [Larinioides sclopetarius]|uniref:BTB domain-containing protein n=1 Tax=Larinioides sclopetarius TaxID=280406 RepID=A0AAV2ALF6_9ARAC
MDFRSRILCNDRRFLAGERLYICQKTLTLQCRMWEDCGDINEFDQSIGRTHLVMERIVSAENFDFEKSIEKTIDIRSKCKNKTLMTISILYCNDMIDVGIDSTREEKMGFSTCRLSLENEWLGKKIFEHKIQFFGRPTKKVWRLPISDKIWPSKIDVSIKSNCTFTTELVYSTGTVNGIIEKVYTPKISQFLSNYFGRSTCRNPKYWPNISEDLLKLVPIKDLCDMVLKAQNRPFSVHKIVLCARSPVFLAMLTSPMKEKEYGCIDIVDISVETMGKFLYFLYRDVILIFHWNEAVELYYVADKYQVKRLKFLCCSYLLENINIGNICELLMLADSHHDYELKQKVNNIIWENDEFVFGSDTWQKLTDEKLELANETMLSKYKGKGNQNSIKTYDESIHPKIQDDFRSLYANRIATDIVVKTANNSYPAYKTILCASSLILR